MHEVCHSALVGLHSIRATGVSPTELILGRMIDSPVASGFLSLGQSAARRSARQAIERGRTGRTLLVHGPAGSNKDRFVDDLLAMLFCTDADRTHRPCNACRGCRQGRARSHPDLVVGSPDAWRDDRGSGESIVAAARRWLLDGAGAPIVADRRVIVIERTDRASEQIQNALLKALEEPTDRHTFILVADEPRGLLATIRSRCQSLRIGAVPRDELTAHLMDTIPLPEDQATALVRVSGGMAGTAEAYAREPALLDWRRRLQAELLSLLDYGRADRFASVRELLAEASRTTLPHADMGEPEAEDHRTPASVQREAAIRIVEAWIALTRDLVVAEAGRPDLAPSRELAPELVARTGSIGIARLLRMASLLDRIHGGLRENTAPRLALESAMLAWPMLPRQSDH